MNNLEVEAKFWVPGLPAIRKQVLALDASLVLPRHLECNLRFDTPDQILTRRGELLRIRKANKVTLTFKRSGERFEVREELELEVHDFELARGLIEGLGFERIHTYEKYREVYKLDDCLIMLDEVPYGCFMEIEGPDLERVRSTAHRLHLNWETRIKQTYRDMFESLRKTMDPEPADATFEVFSNYPPVDIKQLHLIDDGTPSSE